MTKLLKFEEATKQLGLKSISSIYRIIKEGHLTPIYPRPRSPRIREDELNAYINKLNTTTATTNEATMGEVSTTRLSKINEELDALLK